MREFYIVSHCCLWQWPHQKTNQFIGRCHPYARKSASKAVRSRIQITLHATRPTPHGASLLLQAMSAWSVKARRAPSRHCRDRRVHGHTTTATDMSTPPHPRSPVTLSEKYKWVDSSITSKFRDVFATPTRH